MFKKWERDQSRFSGDFKKQALVSSISGTIPAPHLRLCQQIVHHDDLLKLDSVGCRRVLVDLLGELDLDSIHSRASCA